jgi:putative ABC transport system permease protein
MFALRLYPYAVRLLYRLGRSRWPTPLYAALLQAGRSGTQYQFVMVFLIMTIALGLYSAGAARTLNRNAEDLIRYKNGADLVLQQLWARDVQAVRGGIRPAPGAPGGGIIGGAGGAGGVVGSGAGAAGGQARYIEPPFQPFADLPGVEQATKVFVKEGARYRSGPRSGTATLMGIHTAQFGRTAWMREDLLDYPLAAYLNLIARDPQAVLVSRSLAEQGVRPGDTITLGWDGANSRTFTVYGIVDYWPSFQPHSVPEEAQPPALVVGHLDYIQMALGLEPYRVWLKLAEGADRRLIYDRLAAEGVLLVSLADTQEEVRRAMNDPFQLAINGAMTLGFLISTAICLFGFLLYWLLTLSGRTVQYGVFRAMGITFRQLVSMLTAEQLLTSGAAMAIGGAVGGLTGALFIRLFQLSLDPAEQILPFRAAFERLDAIRLLAIVAGMIGCGLLLLSMRLHRLKIDQALKLGED